MVNIIKEELPIEESLRKKLELICGFAKTTPTIINGNIRKIDRINLTYIEPNRIIIKDKTFLIFNYSNEVFIENLSNKIKLSEFEDNRMQGFFHLTTKTQKNFGIKIRMKEPRAYFINYVAPMIKNYLNCSTCDDLECGKIKVWTAPYKNTKRTKLLYSDDLHSYIIILEKNKNDMYIISSYLIDEPGYFQNV